MAGPSTVDFCPHNAYFPTAPPSVRVNRLMIREEL